MPVVIDDSVLAHVDSGGMCVSIRSSDEQRPQARAALDLAAQDLWAIRHPDEPDEPLASDVSIQDEPGRLELCVDIGDWGHYWPQILDIIVSRLEAGGVDARLEGPDGPTITQATPSDRAAVNAVRAVWRQARYLVAPSTEQLQDIREMVLAFMASAAAADSTVLRDSGHALGELMLHVASGATPSPADQQEFRFAQARFSDECERLGLPAPFD